jgi:TatD DNase family protein
MQLVDTHCHIQWSDYKPGGDNALKDAKAEGVSRVICVGTEPKDSLEAIEFANNHEGAFASVGLIPHDAKQGQPALDKIKDMIVKPKVVAIGEIGLEYHHMQSSKEEQKKALEFQIELALKYDLPVIFHIRDAFADFWQIFDKYQGIRGVCHSFSAGVDELNQVLERGLYVGLNGITTFSKDTNQIDAFKRVPLSKMMLETDAPYLTPTPFRGKINEPKYVRRVAEFLSDLRGESIKEIAQMTTTNATSLFGI